MATGEALFSLIQTLSKGEKKTFTRNNKLQEKNKNYSAVFSILSRIGEYDEEEVLARLKKVEIEMTKKSLKDTEAYLYEKLIVTLKGLYKDSYIDIKLRDLILEAQILHKKGLYDLAIEVFNKAEKKAIEYHRNALLLEIIPQKADAIVALKRKNLLKNIDTIYITAHHTIDLLKEEMHYRHENIRLLAGYRTEARTSPVIFEQYQKNQAKIFPINGSFFSKYYYFNILSLSARLCNDSQHAVEYQSKAIEVWDHHPNFIKDNPSLYMAQLANQINYLISAQNYKEAERVIEKITDVNTSFFDQDGEQFQNYYFHKQRLYLNQKNYEKSKQLVTKIENGLKKYKNKINLSRARALHYNISLTFWMLGEYHQALKWIEKLLSDKRSNEHRKDLVRAADLLQLAIFYENNEYDTEDLLVKRIRAIKRKEMNDFEIVLTNFFQQLDNCMKSSKKEQVIFQNFQTALKELNQPQETPYSAYCEWVSQKCNHL